VSNGAPQRDSIFGGVLLVALGALLLLNHFDHSFHFGHLVRTYWPVLIILWGVAKLVDHVRARPDGSIRGPFLTGGEAAILIFVIFVLVILGMHDWLHSRFPDIAMHMEPFNHRYSQTQALAPVKIPAGAHVTIQTARGNITVHPTDSAELDVSANMTASGSNEEGADEAMRKIPVKIEQNGNSYSIHPVNQDNSDSQVSADLDVSVPKSASVTATSDRGDISISGLQGSVSATAQKGDLDLHDIGGDVTADIESGNAQISDIAGDVHVKGHGTEIEVGDVKGNASLEGDFFGPIHLRNISKTTRYVTPRENFTLTELTGRVELDKDSVQVSDVTGAANLTTHNKDIDAENIGGKLTIVDTHASVNVRFSDAPKQDFGITNESGDVDVTLPSGANFEIAAVSRDGDVNSEFSSGSLQTVNQSGTGHLTGKIGNSGPKITIATSYGTINVHKS
jgi:hypothetical protein